VAFFEDAEIEARSSAFEHPCVESLNPHPHRELVARNSGLTDLEQRATNAKPIAYPNLVAGVKDSSGDREHTLALIARYPDLAIFPGTEILLLTGLRAGGAGCITASANVNVAAIRRLYDAGRGSGEDADALERTVRAVRAAMESYPMVPALKCVVARFRDDPAWATVRPPMLALGPDEASALAAKLEAAGFEQNIGQTIVETRDRNIITR